MVIPRLVQGGLGVLGGLYIRQGQYRNIANHWFLVAWNGIKMKCSNTVFYADFRKFPKNLGKVSSTD